MESMEQKRIRMGFFAGHRRGVKDSETCMPFYAGEHRDGFQAGYGYGYDRPELHAVSAWHKFKAGVLASALD